jgi:hypothetical protein
MGAPHRPAAAQHRAEFFEVPSLEWLEFEGGVISSLFAQTESALARRRRLRHENSYHRAAGKCSRRNAFPWGRLVRSLGNRGAEPHSRFHRGASGSGTRRRAWAGPIRTTAACRDQGRRPGGHRGWPSTRPSRSPAHGNLRAGDGPCPPRPSGNIGRQVGGVEERDHSGLPAAHETVRRADRQRLSCWDQHAAGAPGAGGFVRRRRWARTPSAVSGAK